MMPFTIYTEICPFPECSLKLDVPEVSVMSNTKHSSGALAQHSVCRSRRRQLSALQTLEVPLDGANTADS